MKRIRRSPDENLDNIFKLIDNEIDKMIAKRMNNRPFSDTPIRGDY